MDASYLRRKGLETKPRTGLDVLMTLPPSSRAHRLNQAPAPKVSKTALNAFSKSSEISVTIQCYNRSGPGLRFMSRTRDEMRLYQRARRARLNAGAWPTAPKDAPPIAGRPALAPDPASARTAIGSFPATLAGPPAGRPGGLPHGPAPASSGTMSADSTPAIGGRPGRGLVDCGPGYPAPPDIFAASPFGRWQTGVETMLAALAAKNDAQERRIAALERTVALNETAGRMAGALARTIAGLIGARLP